MKVFTDGTDTIIAEGIDDAWKVWEKHCGEKREDYEPGSGNFWEELSDETELSIHDDDHPLPNPQKKTCAEWIKINGRGFLCSTEW